MSPQQTFVDVHILQSVPPSNLNRDDTGTPKQSFYGGVQRARVSSQAWKRATRRDFDQYLDEGELAVRTKRAIAQVATRLVEKHGLDIETATASAVEVFGTLGFKLEKGRKKGDKDGEQNLTEYLTFFSNAQFEQFAEIAAVDPKNKKALLAAAREANGVAVSLFGRMVADDKQLSVDAACQVAHAISTHAATVEHDYYTAVDDNAPADNAGAGMLGTIEYTSATLYRYATVSMKQLEANLGSAEAAVKAARAFVESFVRSMPTGKQNTFANRTPVDAVVVQVRHDQPVNLVGAFEEPVTSGSGYVGPSAQALAAYATQVQDAYAGPAASSFVVRVSAKAEAVDNLGESTTLSGLGDTLAAVLANEGD